jgi:hypothetical protein
MSALAQENAIPKLFPYSTSAEFLALEIGNSEQEMKDI